MKRLYMQWCSNYKPELILIEDLKSALNMGYGNVGKPNSANIFHETLITKKPLSWHFQIVVCLYCAFTIVDKHGWFCQELDILCFWLSKLKSKQNS